MHQHPFPHHTYFITTIERAPPLLLLDQLEVLGQITALYATKDKRSRHDPNRYVGYGITDSWDEIVETLQGAPVSTDTELGAHVRDFESMVRRDTYEIYTMLDDEQSQRQLLASREACGEINGLRVNLARAMRLFTKHHSFLQRSQRSRGKVTALQGQVMTLQGQVTALQGQQGPARGPAQPELPEEAGSSYLD
ncbi:hypothetical protein Tco_0497785 [Tanacetum coccineum]|uniref:Uncharacterized protein n=1 Tax=Tanacetum coccineum TaxID=301880 RepID=A0ABQ5BQG1_9ASTR